MKPEITIRTLTDGGQPAREIAAAVAGFIDGARRTLDLAQYDFDLGPETGAIVVDAIRRAAARGVYIRLAYNVDHARPVPVPPPSAPGRGADRDAAGRRAADRRRARPDAPQVHGPRRRVGLDGLDELDRRRLDEAGERDRRSSTRRRSPPTSTATSTRSPAPGRLRGRALVEPGVARRRPGLVHARATARISPTGSRRRSAARGAGSASARRC